MGKPAQELTKAVRDYLTANGWFVWKGGGGAMKIGTRFIRWGTNGAPDLFALKGGQIKVIQVDSTSDVSGVIIENQTILIGIEIKANRDVQSNAQKAFQADFEEHGGTYLIVRKTEDLDEYI